ncbi:unnamed protein product, partial [Prorocentrum cordatum]
CGASSSGFPLGSPADFIQLSNDAGAPVFQAAQNYPDVSFASSSLFHALVTASLKQGFVPSVMRAQDAAIALAVFGPEGSRLSLAMVTSEFAAGETREVEAQLQWRLRVLYHAALVAVGADLLRRQPTEQLRRLLSQRLSPVARHVMAGEVTPGVCGPVPRLGLAVRGASVEWLAHAPGSRAALDGLVASWQAAAHLSHGGPFPDAAAALSWEGRLVAATPAWLRLGRVDSALLLALAEELGPATFASPARTWALEEAEHLWLPSAASAAAHTAGEAPGGERPRRHRLVSVRLYPPPEGAGELAGQRQTRCASCASAAAEAAGPEAATGPADAPPATGAEAAVAWREEASLVLSVLAEEGADGAPGPHGQAPPVAAQDLERSSHRCGASLQELWRGLRGGAAAAGAWLLLAGPQQLTAAVLLDERAEEVVALPSPWHDACASLPWCCHGRRLKATAVRRLLHWMGALPPLGPGRPQQYVCCGPYAVGAARREDGICCWGIVCAKEEPLSGASPAAPGPEPGRAGGAGAAGGDAVPHALGAAAEVLRRCGTSSCRLGRRTAGIDDWGGPARTVRGWLERLPRSGSLRAALAELAAKT